MANIGKFMTELRASTQDRDNVVNQLQEAFSDGRLSETEFDQRMMAALEAKTITQLDSLLRDLAVSKKTFNYPATSSRTDHGAIAVLGGTERRGKWIVPKTYSVVAVLGGCQIDLREAEFANQSTTINVVAVMGGIEIIVPPDVRVYTQGIPLMGGFSNRIRNSETVADSKELYIRGIACMGGVDIRTKSPRR